MSLSYSFSTFQNSINNRIARIKGKSLGTMLLLIRFQLYIDFTILAKEIWECTFSTFHLFSSITRILIPGCQQNNNVWFFDETCTSVNVCGAISQLHIGSTHMGNVAGVADNLYLWMCYTKLLDTKMMSIGRSKISQNEKIVRFSENK